MSTETWKQNWGKVTTCVCLRAVGWVSDSTLQQKEMMQNTWQNSLRITWQDTNRPKDFTVWNTLWHSAGRVIHCCLPNPTEWEHIVEHADYPIIYYEGGLHRNLLLKMCPKISIIKKICANWRLTSPVLEIPSCSYSSRDCLPMTPHTGEELGNQQLQSILLGMCKAQVQGKIK